MTELETTLRRRTDAGEKLLAPFVTAGYPDIPTTVEVLRAVDDLGLGCLEIGIPFSDPIADGPTIQKSFTDALSAGLRVGDLLDALGKVAGELTTPRIAMVSYSIGYRRGVENFLRRAADAGFAGVLFPDLPMGAEPAVGELAESIGLANVMLVSPTTPPARRGQIAAAAGGFVYCMSVAGVTGERTELPPELGDNVAALKAAGGGTPVFVGFGIGSAEQVRLVTQVADGAIVGSAIVRRMSGAIESGESPGQVAGTVRSYVRELSSGLPRPVQKA